MINDSYHFPTDQGPRWLDARARVAAYLRCHRVPPAQIPLLTSAILNEARSRPHSGPDLVKVAMSVAMERLNRSASWPAAPRRIPSATPWPRLTHMVPKGGKKSPAAHGSRQTGFPGPWLWGKLTSLAAFFGFSARPTRSPSR
jgi:hypothetical protein